MSAKLFAQLLSSTGNAMGSRVGPPTHKCQFAVTVTSMSTRLPYNMTLIIMCDIMILIMQRAFGIVKNIDINRTHDMSRMSQFVQIEMRDYAKSDGKGCPDPLRNGFTITHNVGGTFMLFIMIFILSALDSHYPTPTPLFKFI